MKAVRFGLILITILVLIGSSAVAGDGTRQTPYSQLVPYTAREIHQTLAAEKAEAAARQELMALARQQAVGQEDFDAQYYNIDLRIDEVDEMVYGRVKMQARSLITDLQQVAIDLYDNMVIDSVYENGALTEAWTHTSNLLTVDLATGYGLDETFDITVVYSGHPSSAGFQAFSFGSHDGTPVISTLSEPFMARTWWPCKDRPDDKADSVDIIVEVNSAFFVSSNGVLRDSVNHGLTTTYHWHEQYPITTYLVSLAISEYEHFYRWYSYGPANQDSMVVDFYPYPDLLWEAVMAWGVTIDQLEFFADAFGEYPFVEEKYGMTHFTWGGAMEHQTNTSTTSGSFGFNQYLIAHELAHQWWGNLITVESWHHIWLNEGFASYAEALYAEHRYGTDSLHGYMVNMQYPYGGTIYIANPTSVGAIFTSRVYDKGAWFLHMLRGVVGHDTFWEILQTYYSHPEFAHAHANTEDFQGLCENVSGMDLDQLFQDWIYGEYYPKYYYSWITGPGAPGEQNIFLHVEQYQTSNPLVFDLPIMLAVHDAGGMIDTISVHNNQRQQDFIITVETADPITDLEFDPANWILDSHSYQAYGFHIANETVAPGNIQTAYLDSVFAKGGSAPYSYQMTTGALPAGLTFDPVTGVISGTPTEFGVFTFTVTAQDAQSELDVQEFSLTIDEQPAIAAGDVNGDGNINPVDVVFMVQYVYQQYDPPPVLNAADVNADCVIDPLDVSIMVNYVFRDRGELLPGCVE